MSRQAGFTLIELMVTVVIVAILAAIAVPSYQSHVVRSRRVDAMSALMALQQAEERYRSNNASYGTLAQLGGGSASPDGYYTLSITSPTASGYTATATPVAGKSQAGDTACPTITVTVATGSTVYGPSASCWGK